MAQFGATSTPRNRSLLYLQDGEHHRAASLFNGQHDPTAVIKARRCDSGFWNHTDNIPEGVRSFIVSAGFDGVLRTGYHKIDHHLITALVERWRPETHTFHFPTGEATITLQDVQVLWGLPLDGPVVSGEWECKGTDEWSSDCFAYLGFRPVEDEVAKGRITMQRLVEAIDTPCNAENDGYMKRARCYILALLGGHLFSDSRSYDVPLNFLKNIDDLSEYGRLSWGSAVLAYLYRQLCTAAEDKSVKGIQGPLILLQLWAWERIPVIAPRMRRRVGAPEIYPHCVGSKYHRQFCSVSNTNTPVHVLVAYRSALTTLEEGQFIWCPYTEVLGDLVDDCTRDSGLWSYTGWLVWWCVAEPHVPHRVCRQFGFRQGIPENGRYFFTVGEHVRNHEGKFSGGRGTDWVRKKIDKIVCWNDRHNRVHHFDGPAGVGVLPGYMQWYYDRTVLLITSPAAHNPPNVYPDWGGVQQVQNETLREIHDRAQRNMDSGLGNNVMWQDFVQLPNDAMGYGHNLDRMNYGSQQFAFPPPGYYPRPPSPPPQYGQQLHTGWGGSQFQTGEGSSQHQQFQSGGGNTQQFQQHGQDLINELFSTPTPGLTPTHDPSWLSLSPNITGDYNPWVQPEFQRDPGTDMVARRSHYDDSSPVQFQSLGDYGLDQPPNPQDEEAAQPQPRRSNRIPQPTRCFTGSRLHHHHPPH